MAKFVGGLTINEFEENFGTVKSVQRGTTTLSSDTTSITVNINSINMAKSIILVSNYVNRYWLQNNYGSPNVEAQITSNTTITLTTYTYSSSGYSDVSWQVIEFY